VSCIVLSGKSRAQENCKVANLREGEAPAEPGGSQNTAQQELRPPLFAFLNDFADLLELGRKLDDNLATMA
jgi:hypothetical protein